MPAHTSASSPDNINPDNEQQQGEEQEQEQEQDQEHHQQQQRQDLSELSPPLQNGHPTDQEQQHHQNGQHQELEEEEEEEVDKKEEAEVHEEEEEEDYGVDDESGEEVIDSKFTWRDHWYPFSSLEDLDPLLPIPFQLLVRDLVLWFDKATQEWVAFDDQCPHRLAPLSEGWIDENGHMQCSYRGWSYDGCGWCAQIPQAMPEGPEAHAVKSPRAYATRSPTMVSQGYLLT
uniref:Rieske domain-containing protein n=1 Tax=Populus davidiana TaxID=266767 RepID=A0A6M2F9C9_9ROSI